MKWTLLYLYTEHNLKSYALKRNGFRVLIESWDKDLLQLINNTLTFPLHQDLLIFIKIPIVLFNNSYPIVRIKIQIITKTI